MEATTLDQLLRVAVEANVLVTMGAEGYAFRHALLSEAIYGDLLPGERVRLHAAYAQALSAAGGLGAPPSWPATPAAPRTCLPRCGPASSPATRPWLWAALTTRPATTSWHWSFCLTSLTRQPRSTRSTSSGWCCGPARRP